MEVDNEEQEAGGSSNVADAEQHHGEYRPFNLKRWNCLAMWSWDVSCDICAICRLPLTEDCLRCQSDSAAKTGCVVVWGECSHSYHNCCMSHWVRQNNRCPLCQQEWTVQRIGQ